MNRGDYGPTCTPLKFQRLNPYVFMITANVHDQPVRIVLRDPEQADVDRHGLQCLIRVSGGAKVRLQIGETFRLRLQEDGVIPEMCWLMAHAADFHTGEQDHENTDH